MRIRLLDELKRRGELTVQGLADEIRTTQQNASRHLGLLLQEGLVARRGDGRVVWYRLADEQSFGVMKTAAVTIIQQLSAAREGP